MRKQDESRPQTAQHLPDREGDVADAASREHQQAKEAIEQMGTGSKLQINEGGRTQDSTHTHNPPGAVHGLPKPAIKGTSH